MSQGPSGTPASAPTLHPLGVWHQLPWFQMFVGERRAGQSPALCRLSPSPSSWPLSRRPSASLPLPPAAGSVGRRRSGAREALTHLHHHNHIVLTTASPSPARRLGLWISTPWWLLQKPAGLAHWDPGPKVLLATVTTGILSSDTNNPNSLHAAARLPTSELSLLPWHEWLIHLQKLKYIRFIFTPRQGY